MSARQAQGEHSRDGRRVLVATVTGPAGEAIQQWRTEHDPLQAVRLPPHTTLCYWVSPDLEPSAIERQVRHAFDLPIAVELGTVREFDNPEHTFYLPLSSTEGLDRARRRLYDGSHVDFGVLAGEWTWHVTCVRDSNGRDLAALRSRASTLAAAGTWRIELVELLELRGDRYEPVRPIRL